MNHRASLVLALLLIAPLSVASVAAHSPNPNGNCDNVGDESEIVIEDVVTVSGNVADLVYVFVDTEADVPVQLFVESNDWPGLQTHTHTCRDNDFVSHTIEADTALL